MVQLYSIEDKMHIPRVTYLGPHTIMRVHDPDTPIPGTYVSALDVLVCFQG